MKIADIPFRRLATTLLGLALAPIASASDGVYEINQACATSTGCFPGDTPGFPVTINSSGAYRFTSDLRLSDATDIGVQVTGSYVDLDMNGFGISCSEFSPPFSVTPCSDSQNTSGNGIQAISPVTGLRIRNGTVSNMAANGLNVFEAHISGVAAISNARVGILVGGRSIVEKSIARENGDFGIRSVQAARIADSLAELNGATGIVAGAGSTVVGNVVTGNGGSGISGVSSLISQNAASENATLGISGNSSKITLNSANSNGTTGIVAFSGSIDSNVSNANGIYGISVSQGASYRENSMNANGTDDVLASGTVVNLGSNACSGTICP